MGAETALFFDTMPLGKSVKGSEPREKRNCPITGMSAARDKYPAGRFPKPAENCYPPPNGILNTDG